MILQRRLSEAPVPTGIGLQLIRVFLALWTFP